MRLIKTIVLIAIGFVLLGIGAVGIFVPVWPTTPFVLLSMSCFSCSPKLRARILRIKFFREHYENYKERHGLSRRTVAVSLGYLWGMLLLSIVLLRTMWSAVLLCCIGAAVTVHILVMARARQRKPHQNHKQYQEQYQSKIEISK